MWWILVIHLCYDVPLLLIYLCIFYIIVSRRSSYCSSFFSLFLAANLIIAANSFITIRIPAQVCGSCFLNVMYTKILVPPVSSLLYFLTFQLFFTYQALMFFMALNRLSAILQPVRYEKVWSLAVIPMSVLAYCLPVCVTYPLLIYPSQFKHVRTVDGYIIRMVGADIQPVFAALISFILVVTALTLLVNLLTVYFFVQRKSRNRAENALLFTSFASFIIQSAVAVMTAAFAVAAKDRERRSWISRFAMNGYPYVSDLATLSSPLLLLAFSTPLRTDMWRLLTGRFNRRSSFLSRQASRKSQIVVTIS